jgi:large subunit ribosomal protein L17
MRHLKKGRAFSIQTSHRQAMFSNMVTSLMEHGRIETTEPKAKELRRIAEHIITLSKRVPAGDAEHAADRVHAIRLARRWITDRDVLQKIFSEYSARYADRPGGYTRIYKLGSRAGDRAPTAIIELVTEPMGG